jgi:hypothetical protein
MAAADASRFAAADFGRRPFVMVIIATTVRPRASAGRLPQLAGDAWNAAADLRVGKRVPQLAGDAWSIAAAARVGRWFPQLAGHPRNVFVHAASTVARRIVSRHWQPRGAADAEQVADALPGSRSGHPAARTDRDAWSILAAPRVGRWLPQLGRDAWSIAAAPWMGKWLP